MDQSNINLPDLTKVKEFDIYATKFPIEDFIELRNTDT